MMMIGELFEELTKWRGRLGGFGGWREEKEERGEEKVREEGGSKHDVQSSAE